jgi:cellulose biosynthesis protein BcsQ
MAKIIFINSMKGGIGKSQTTVMAATALAAAPFNLKVAIVDIDDQKSIMGLREIDQSVYESQVAPYDIFSLEVNDLQQRIGELDKVYQVIFIDAAGKLDTKLDALQQEISRSVMYTDFLFMPFVAGNFNFSANYKYLHFVRQIQSARQLTNRPLRVVAFVNMFRQRSRASQFLVQDLADLRANEGLQTMQVHIGDYAAFREADTFTSLYDPLSNDSAKANFSEWLNEFIGIIQS